MKRKYSLAIATICVSVFVFGGCVNNDDSGTDKSLSLEVTPINMEIGEQSNSEVNVQDETGTQNNTEKSIQGQTENSSLPSDSYVLDQADTDLEKQLERYRQEREDTIQEANGLVEGGSPDESSFTFDLSGTSYSGQFDTRETTEGYAAARIYVTDTLGIKPGTKQVVYMCVDPRILAIYDDEDKGVASGYDNSNIFLCEYCGEGNVWQYLILVRDSKGTQWKVIHNGRSYKE